MTKAGRKISPVEIAGRKITATFWGDAWCRNLEAYSDYANRLPRGRTYVRNGSVIDLQIEAGRVRALISGTEIYEWTSRSSPSRSRGGLISNVSARARSTRWWNCSRVPSPRG